jgi:tetratricopeptide (TPR) repeat protein
VTKGSSSPIRAGGSSLPMALAAGSKNSHSDRVIPRSTPCAPTSTSSPNACPGGRYNDVIDYARAGQQLAGVSHAMVQLVLQEARGRARLGQRREVRASLDRGTKLLEQLPRPEHPEHHFVFDHTKWIFYAATCYTWLGDDEPAEEHAREIIAYHTNPDGSSNAPMRTANAHIDLGIVLARHGELDEAVDHGLQAFQFERKTEASLLSHAADLDHDLEQLYPRERLAEPFHDQYADARRRLRSQRRLRR